MAEVASSLIGKVVDLLYGVAIKEISYMWNCSENVENLKNEVEKLSVMKGRVQQQIDLANSKGDILTVGVEEWMKKAHAKISEATEFISEEAEAKKACFNLGTLHHYSKTAAKKTSFLVQHQECGKGFETCVSLPACTPSFTDVFQRKNLENMHTQKSTLMQIIRAIEEVQIVGIHGLGGVGKTTLASEAAATMENQFAYIVLVTVSQTINTKEILDKLQVAAKRIMKGEKVLIILDDVWKGFELQEVGIPCGNHNNTKWKILLTSRSKEVFVAMNAQKIILVSPLDKKDAWTLFERVVCKSEWDDKLKKVALKIVQECGGLPLFVKVVGKALKNKEFKIWEAALGRLQAPSNGDASYKREGLLQLKLSYDYLEDEVAKTCFLLCSMFPEDGIVDLERLTYYGLGLGIFNNPDSDIQDAKEILQLVIDSLGSSFLLFPTKIICRDCGKILKDEVFIMHDLVRDMALYITSKGNDKFLVQSGKGLSEWQPRIDIVESYKKISLMRNQICKLPDYELHFPYLDTFLIQDNNLSYVPNEFFQGMKELKVLDMSSNNISSLPQSLKHLKKLRTLDLSRNKSLCEISILGELTCLEILKLRSTGITKIPKEIGQLIRLRLLDVYTCEDLSYVTPGVMSNLTRLEELYVQFGREGNCNFLVELSKLKLKILHLRLPELHSIPKIETLIELDVGESV